MAPEVSEQAKRDVLATTRFSWLSSLQPAGFLPSAVSLGGRTSGRVILFFEFEASKVRADRLRGAYLMLQTAERSRTFGPVTVEMTRSEAPVRPLVEWSDQPSAVYPRLSVELAPNSGVLRLDVTELVEADLKTGRAPRLMLRAEPGAAEGLLIATGAAGGAAPWLELYSE